MRAVVRNGVSMDLINLLLEDMRVAIAFLDALPAPIVREDRANAVFHH